MLKICRFGVDHFLYAHTDEHFFMGKVIFDPVSYGSRGVQTGPTVLNICNHLVRTLYPEIGILLTGKAGAGQIFGGGTRANRHWNDFDGTFAAPQGKNEAA